nr:IS1380 family transposase [uncultured Blautia sp.]
MSIVNTFSLQSNRQIKINFDGGDLSSDAGLLLIKEFISRLGIERILNRSFKTNDSAVFRYHTDRDNLLQMIYMIMAGYFEDDASDELTKDPVFKAVLEKSALASQPTVSRFFNRMDEDTLKQFQEISQILRKRIYSIQMPQAVILDLDSTLLAAYGKQEGRAFNFHYRSNGYHPLVCYDGITGDLIKIQFRDGAAYSCTGVTDFLQPILDEYLNDYPTIHLLLRGDSGFATPDLYKQCEENGTSYVIRLKENFIKESKSGFDFSAVSSHNRIVNANRVQVHALAYNIFNWFRRLVLSAKMRKQRIDTVRLKLLKIATKVVHSARYITFKLCSSCPYKEEFYAPLSAIGKLNVQLE